MMSALSGETQHTRMLVWQGWRTLSICGHNARKHASCRGITSPMASSTTTAEPDFKTCRDGYGRLAMKSANWSQAVL
jgi:hypothetical protein